MQVIDLELDGLKLVEPTIFKDERGFFLESYRNERYIEKGIHCNFVQDNFAYSKKDTIRGMHYQSYPGQSKLVSVSRGKIFDVAVDIRPNSKTFGKYVSVILDDEKMQQLFVPHGFAHGYCVLSNGAHVQYKVSHVYNPKTEQGFRYNDPEIRIEWPVKMPLLSLRDLRSPKFSEIDFKEMAL